MDDTRIREKVVSEVPSSATNAASIKKTNKRPHDRSSSQRKNKRPKKKHSPDNTFPHVDDTKLHAARIATRQRDIDKGKNTAGYAAYRQQVPLTARKARSMETPSTPKPTWDVSVKRWQGLVRAWRKALHHYDPPELGSPVAAAASPMVEETTPISMRDGFVAEERQCTPVRMLDFSAAMDGESSDDDDELL